MTATTSLGRRWPHATRVAVLVVLMCATGFQTVDAQRTRARSLLAQPAPATSPLPALREFHVRVFDASDGLPGADVRHLLQAADGYIYMAGGRGLARFDGHDIHSIALPGFRSLDVTSMLEARDGRVWLRNSEGGIGYFADERFTALAPAPVATDLWNETSDGTLWMGGTQGLVALHPAAAPTFVHYTREHGLPELAVAGVFDTYDGERLLLSQGYLSRIIADSTRETGWRVEPVDSSFRSARQIYDPARVDRRGVWFSAYDRNGQQVLVRYFRGVVTHHVYRPGLPPVSVDSLDLSGDSIGGPAAIRSTLSRMFEVSASNPQRIGPKQYLSYLLRARDGDHWLAVTDTTSSRMISRVVRRHANELHELDLRDALPFTRVQRIIEDHEGSIWVGTDRGLVQLSKRRVFALTPTDGLAADFTSPVLQTRDGTLWVGTWGGGLNGFRGGTLAVHLTVQDGLPYNQIRALHEDAAGELWVGTSLGYARVGNDRVLESIPLREEVRSFAHTPDGTVWIGTAKRLLHRSARGTTERRSEIFTGFEIWALHADREGNLWVGGDRGLVRVRLGAEERADLVERFDASHGLLGTAVSSIAEEADGTLWIGTYGNGLHRWREGTFAAVTTEHGLHDNGVWRVLPDGAGGVWMSSDRGIFRVDHARLHDVADAVQRADSSVPRLSPLVFTEADGLPNRESNRGSPAGWRLRDGRLVFNNLQGLVIVDPREATRTTSASQVVLSSVMADGSAIPATASRVFTVPPGTRRFELEFVALSFLAPAQIRYRYRLDGYDRDWVDGGTQRRATFTGVAPGRYTFVAQATDASGAWQNAELQAAVVVLPTYHQTWWFRTLAVLLGVGTVVGAWRFQTSRVLELHRLRWRIASDLHDDIGSNLSSIALQSELLQSRAQDRDADREQLMRIQHTSAETIQALRDIIWLVNPKHDSLPDFEARLRGLALELRDTHVVHFDGDIATAPVLSIPVKRQVLLVYKEMLHNVRKHARANTVRIRVHANRERIEVSVADDGVGFDAHAEVDGHGLRSITQRAKQLGGELRVESEGTHGTSVTLLVPLT